MKEIILSDWWEMECGRSVWKNSAACVCARIQYQRCAVTSKSNWTIDSGTLVAGPLLKGGDYCLLHAKPFLTKASRVEDFEQIVIIILDLETTGIDKTKDRVVELAAVHAHSDSRMDCESFATTIQVDANIVMGNSAESLFRRGRKFSRVPLSKRCGIDSKSGSWM